MSILLAPELLFLSLISFYSCCVESFDSNTTGAGVTSLDKLCPYTNYCTKNKTNSRDNVEEVPCCRNCFCGNNCWKRGDCCSDKENKTVKQPLESCEIVVVKHSPYYHPTQFGGNFFQRYFVIKSCPRKDDPLADKCSGNLQSYLEDYVWVTDKTTNDIYNNKHCAICNEVRNYSPWQVRTDCTEAMNGHNSPEAAVNYILKECEIIVGPPSMESHSDDICMVPDITQCNVTGQWESHDLALETACNNFNQIYLEEKAWTTVAYRNVCCFLCNSPRGQHVPDICPNGAARPKFSNNGFSGILDYRAFERVKETAANDVLGSDLVCAIDEIEDPVQVQCLKLSCPMLQAPVYGRCVKLTTMTMGLGVKAMLLFEPIWSKTSLQFEELSITEDLAKKLFTKVQRDLDLSERKCKPCIESVRAYGDNTVEETEGVMVLEMFSIHLSYQTTKACQEAIIAERLSWLIGKELKLKFGQEHVTMNVSAVPQKEYDGYQYKAGGEAMHLTLHPCNTYQFADFQQLLSCPSVSLNTTDYLRLMHMADGTPRKRYINSLIGLAQIGDKVARPSENFTAQVCYESYLSVVRIENHGVTLLSIKIVLVGMGLVSTMFWT